MALEHDIAILARVPMMAFLDREALRLLAFASQTRALAVGDILFRKGEAADAAYVVTAGAITLETGEDNAPNAYVAREGALIGGTALITPTARAATAVAREPASVMKLSRDLMLRVLQEFPDSAIKLKEDFAQRLSGLAGELAGVREALVTIDEA